MGVPGTTALSVAEINDRLMGCAKLIGLPVESDTSSGEWPYLHRCARAAWQRDMEIERCALHSPMEQRVLRKYY